MDQTDRQAIEELFGKLAAVERQAPLRDAGAEAFIRDAMARQPAAAYYMAQTIIMQEQALAAAEQRLSALDKAPAPAESQPRGGFLSRLTGGGGSASSVPHVPRQRAASPFQNRQGFGGGGGGFLAGAAQTAMGVAGGVLLGNAIAGMFGNDAAAAETPAEEDWNHDEPDTFDDAGQDDAGYDDAGYDEGE